MDKDIKEIRQLLDMHLARITALKMEMTSLRFLVIDAFKPTKEQAAEFERKLLVNCQKLIKKEIERINAVNPEVATFLQCELELYRQAIESQ